MDENAFFRSAAKQVCGTLDIKIAMERCRKFLKEYIPIDAINLGFFDPVRCGIQIVVRSGITEEVKIAGNFLPMPPETWESFKWKEKNPVRVLNDPSAHVAGSNLIKVAGTTNLSVMLMRLEIENERIGVISVVSRGKNRFNSYHSRLFTLIHDPIAIAMSNALKHREITRMMDHIKDDNLFLRQEILGRNSDIVVGRRGGLRGVTEKVQQVAHLNSPVLLLGETGVGKEVIANMIHRRSSRSNGPLIKVNCGAIAPQLIDSELFGHEKGAFTGAVESRRGHFERAHKGTLLLDEVGELPLNAQVRLLRVLQSKEIRRVGGKSSIQVDVRIIAATHRDLEQMVCEGLFREDLWFRLFVFPITIPPLRERPEDIKGLISYFIGRKSFEMGFPTPPEISQESLRFLGSHPWHGNVRELENLVERSLIVHRGKGGNTSLEIEPILNTVAPKHKVTLHEENSLTLDEAVKFHIESVLGKTRGKIHGPGGAAEILGINANTLRSKMTKMNIPFSKYRRQAGPEKYQG